MFNYQGSFCFCLSHATAILEYHIFVSLSTTFLNFIFKLFAHNYILSLCSRRYRFPSRDSLVRIAHNVVNCQHCFCFFFNLNNLFNFHAIEYCFLTILPTRIYFSIVKADINYFIDIRPYFPGSVIFLPLFLKLLM